ncbi:hypothetical protein HDE79_000943 [Rhodanobacter sp. MP1X3]|nr:hypothetical protein [Rhodanobacter sp. MP1X3]
MEAARKRSRGSGRSDGGVTRWRDAVFLPRQRGGNRAVRPPIFAEAGGNGKSLPILLVSRDISMRFAGHVPQRTMPPLYSLKSPQSMPARVQRIIIPDYQLRRRPNRPT